MKLLESLLTGGQSAGHVVAGGEGGSRIASVQRVVVALIACGQDSCKKRKTKLNFTPRQNHVQSVNVAHIRRKYQATENGVEFLIVWETSVDLQSPNHNGFYLVLHRGPQS